MSPRGCCAPSSRRSTAAGAWPGRGWWGRCPAGSPGWSKARCRKPGARRVPAACTSSRSRWRPRSAPGCRCTSRPGNMVVDVGGGTTEVAVISLGGVVTSQSIRVGGDEMDQAIIVFAKKEYSLLLGERTAQQIKIAVGSACPSPDEPRAEIRGRDLVSGLPKTIVISAEEVRHAIQGPVSTVVDIVQTTLGMCPPELAGDIMDRGIALTGGGALLRGLDERLREETGMPVHPADSPPEAGVLRAGKCV